MTLREIIAKERRSQSGQFVVSPENEVIFANVIEACGKKKDLADITAEEASVLVICANSGRRALADAAHTVMNSMYDQVYGCLRAIRSRRVDSRTMSDLSVPQTIAIAFAANSNLPARDKEETLQNMAALIVYDGLLNLFHSSLNSYRVEASEYVRNDYTQEFFESVHKNLRYYLPYRANIGTFLSKTFPATIKQTKLKNGDHSFDSKYYSDINVRRAKAEAALQMEGNQNPTDAEVAAWIEKEYETTIGVSSIKAARLQAQSHVSIAACGEMQDNHSYADPEKQAMIKAVQDEVNQMIEDMPPSQARVMQAVLEVMRDEGKRSGMPPASKVASKYAEMYGSKVETTSISHFMTLGMNAIKHSKPKNRVAYEKKKRSTVRTELSFSVTYNSEEDKDIAAAIAQNALDSGSLFMEEDEDDEI